MRMVETRLFPLPCGEGRSVRFFCYRYHAGVGFVVLFWDISSFNFFFRND